MLRKFFVLLSGLTIALLPAAGLAAAPAPNAAAKTKTSIICESRKFVATDNQQKRFVDYLTLRGGQEDLPLTLTFFNGSDRTPGLANVQVLVSGRPFLSPSDFAASKMVSVNVTNKFTAGNTAIAVSGMAVPGATFSWKLTAPAAPLESLEPREGGTGAKVTLKGTNFSPVRSDNVVMFEGSQAEVVSADPKSIVIKVPSNAKSGDNSVKVTIKGVSTEAVKFKVKVPPELSSLSLLSSPPEQPLTILGKNFSPNIADNKVTIGGVAAPIESASPNVLQVVIPEMEFPRFQCEVNVESNGMKATNIMYIDITQRVY